MKQEIPPRIAEPCPKSWDEMSGDAQRRFCGHCRLHVHNLSAMTSAERHGVLSAGSTPCVTYAVNARGALVSDIPSNWLVALLSRFRVAFIAVAAAVLPVALSSCVTRLTGMVPAHPPTTDDGKQATTSNTPLMGRIGSDR